MRTAFFPDLLQAGRGAVEAALAAAVRANRGRILAVDATCGNGHDTVFLAACLDRHSRDSSFAVLSLDVQKRALQSAALLLAASGLASFVTFFQRGHEELDEILAAYAALLRKQGQEEGVLAAVMYNLGFLPHSDKRVTTRAGSTLRSLSLAAVGLATNGILSVHAYGGHAGGLEELRAVDAWCAALPFDEWLVARYCMANKDRNPEVLHLAWKRP